MSADQAVVLTPDGVAQLAVVWSPEDAAALARELEALTGRPVPLPEGDPR